MPAIFTQTAVSDRKHGSVETQLNYLSRDSKINRRYFAPGAELNTGKYEMRNVIIRDARPDRASHHLDSNGFILVDHKSMVSSVSFKISQIV